MASSGAAAWAKYYQGKGDVATKMKKAGPAYDPDEPNKTLGPIPANTPVTVLKSSKFEQRALIKFEAGGKTYYARVPFDNIAKPGVKASGAASLKPQAFNIGDKKYGLAEYKQTVLKAIETRKDLPPLLQEYLEMLFRYCSGERAFQQKLATMYRESANDLPLNDINKDFGEVLGPVALHSFQLLKSKGVMLPSTMQVYVPPRPNEPLMDYAVFAGSTKYTISAKSGTTTNVVKPADIINLIESNSEKKRKWSNTNEFKLLQTLQQYSALEGPIRAVSVLYPKLIPQNIKIDKSTNVSVTFAEFIRQNTYLKSKKSPTLNEVMYECEKMIQQETKTGKINMNKLFADAISGQVIYVKFELDSSGVGSWDVIASDNIGAANSKRIYMRSKNGYTRASDKMGIQV